MVENVLLAMHRNKLTPLHVVDAGVGVDARNGRAVRRFRVKGAGIESFWAKEVPKEELERVKKEILSLSPNAVRSKFTARKTPPHELLVHVNVPVDEAHTVVSAAFREGLRSIHHEMRLSEDDWLALNELVEEEAPAGLNKDNFCLIEKKWTVIFGPRALTALRDANDAAKSRGVTDYDAAVRRISASAVHKTHYFRP